MNKSIKEYADAYFRTPDNASLKYVARDALRELCIDTAVVIFEPSCCFDFNPFIGSYFTGQIRDVRPNGFILKSRPLMNPIGHSESSQIVRFQNNTPTICDLTQWRTLLSTKRRYLKPRFHLELIYDLPRYGRPITEYDKDLDEWIEHDALKRDHPITIAEMNVSHRDPFSAVFLNTGKDVTRIKMRGITFAK